MKKNVLMKPMKLLTKIKVYVSMCVCVCARASSDGLVICLSGVFSLSLSLPATEVTKRAKCSNIALLW